MLWAALDSTVLPALCLPQYQLPVPKMWKGKTEAGVREQGSFWGGCLMLRSWTFLTRDIVPWGTRNRAPHNPSGGRRPRSRGFLRTKMHLGFYLLYMLCTTSQGIQLHSHFKVKIQTSGETEVLFLLWKTVNITRTKPARDRRKFSLVHLWYWHPKGSFSSVSRHFGTIVKSQIPQKLQIFTCRFFHLQLRKWRQGWKNRWELSLSEVMCLRSALFVELLRSNNHRRSLVPSREGEFGSYGPVLPSFKDLL